MRRAAIDISPRILAVGVVVSVTLVVAACLAFAASWPVRLAAAVFATYVVLSLFLHPRHSLLSDPFAIHNLTRVNLLVGCVFSTLYVASDTLLHNEALVLTALTVTFVSLLLADVGVLFLRSAPTTASVADDNDGLIYRLLFLLFLAGWSWRVYAFSQGLLQGTLLGTKLELSGSSNALGTLNGLAGIAMWGCVIFSRRPRRNLPLVGAEVLWLLVTGSKAATLYILVPFVMVLYRRDLIRIDLRFVAGVAVLLVVFVGSFVVIHGYRVAVAKQIVDVGYAELSPVRAVSEIEVDPEDFQLVGQSLTERLNFAERFLLILDVDDREPRDHWYGRSYLMALTWAVPRAVWTDKPSMSLGRFFATEYLGWGEESRSEAGVTLWGEGFLNFGILGALVAPGIWMILLQAVYGFGLRHGRWGLYFVAAGYMLMVNSLSANVALPVASLSQLALVILGLRALVSTATVLGARLEVRPHG